MISSTMKQLEARANSVAVDLRRVADALRELGDHTLADRLYNRAADLDDIRRGVVLLAAEREK